MNLDEQGIEPCKLRFLSSIEGGIKSQVVLFPSVLRPEAGARRRQGVVIPCSHVFGSDVYVSTGSDQINRSLEVVFERPGERG